MVLPTKALPDSRLGLRSAASAPISIHNGMTEEIAYDIPKIFRHLFKQRENVTNKHTGVREMRNNLRNKSQALQINLLNWMRGVETMQDSPQAAERQILVEHFERCQTCHNEYAKVEEEFKSVEMDFIREQFKLASLEKKAYEKLKLVVFNFAEHPEDSIASSLPSQEFPILDELNASQYSSASSDWQDNKSAPRTLSIDPATGLSCQLASQQDYDHPVPGIRRENEMLWESPVSRNDHQIIYADNSAAPSIHEDTELSGGIPSSEDNEEENSNDGNVYPLLLDEERDRDMLNPLLTEFNNSRDRVNQWLLHRLRVSRKNQRLLLQYVSSKLCEPLDISTHSGYALKYWTKDEAATASNWPSAFSEHTAIDHTNMPEEALYMKQQGGRSVYPRNKKPFSVQTTKKFPIRSSFKIQDPITQPSLPQQIMSCAHPKLSYTHTHSEQSLRLSSRQNRSPWYIWSEIESNKCYSYRIFSNGDQYYSDTGLKIISKEKALEAVSLFIKSTTSSSMNSARPSYSQSNGSSCTSNDPGEYGYYSQKDGLPLGNDGGESSFDKEQSHRNESPTSVVIGASKMYVGKSSDTEIKYSLFDQPDSIEASDTHDRLSLEIEESKSTSRTSDNNLHKIDLPENFSGKRFFEIGRVFAMLREKLPEVALDVGETITTIQCDGSRKTWDLAWMLVVENIEECCVCSPIDSSNDKIDQASHIMTHIEGEQPFSPEQESVDPKRSISIIPVNPDQILHPNSSVDLDEIYIVNYDVKVINIGFVNQKSLPNIIEFWNSRREKTEPRSVYFSRQMKTSKLD
ncbi:MAG: hypothetical protein M1834_002780 [Cirrosporium novae-zelandiae]|nr:MAG: hypothetical protein M1834_002780 [Cirrosporium novae-zelandiae]